LLFIRFLLLSDNRDEEEDKIASEGEEKKRTEEKHLFL
jgi:hypothetical protein